MTKLQKWLSTVSSDERSSIKHLILGYLGLTILCFLILLLPLFQGQQSSITDHWFFAVSIVSTTGLVPADFASSYNLGGQIISLFFIQLGGIGYMALSSFIVLKRVDHLPKLSVSLLRLEFNLPKKYPLIQFTYAVFIFTLIIEFIGTIILYHGFKIAGVDHPLWTAIFHSISAFCTAGFSLFDGSLVAFKDQPLIFYTISVLSLLGSIGFIVLLDFWNKVSRKRKSITLTSKIILLATFFIIALSTIIIFVSDSNFLRNGWIGLSDAFFQSVSAHTTVGFNTFDLGKLGTSTLFVMILIMIIGASPSGTGGGIKTTSITALFAVLKSILKRSNCITFMNREIPSSNIYLAIASSIFYAILLCTACWTMLLIEGSNFTLSEILFESSSALSTVGLSTGITADLSDGSKIVLSLLMFIGRLGVITFGFALISKTPMTRSKTKVEDIAL